MGANILGGLLVGAGRGIEAFGEAKRAQEETALDKRLAELQFKELGLRIEKAEFNRDKRVALGSPEEQAEAEKEFNETMRQLDIDAQTLDNKFTEARTKDVKRQTELRGLAGQQLDDKTNDLLASLRNSRKILESERDVLDEAGADETQLAAKDAEIQSVNEELLALESAVQQGLIAGGQFPQFVRNTLTDLLSTPQGPIGPQTPTPRPKLFGRGDPEKGPQPPLLLDKPTEILRRAIIEPVGDIVFKAPITAVERFFKGRDPFAKSFRFAGTDNTVQPGSLTSEQVESALQSGIIEEIPLESISEQTGPVPFFGAPRRR